MRKQLDEAKAQRSTGTKARTTRKPTTRTKRQSKPVNRQQHGLRKALLGAFLLGAIVGAFQTEHPWHGASIFANASLVLAYGLGVAFLMTFVWSLTAIRKWVAALIWRERV